MDEAMFSLQGHQLAQVKVSGQEGPHPAGFWVVGCKLAIIDSVEGHRSPPAGRSGLCRLTRTRAPLAGGRADPGGSQLVTHTLSSAGCVGSRARGRCRPPPAASLTFCHWRLLPGGPEATFSPGRPCPLPLYCRLLDTTSDYGFQKNTHFRGPTRNRGTALESLPSGLAWSPAL